MEKAFVIFLTSLLIFGATQAKAQSGVNCGAYLGQKITPATFDSAIAGFSKLSPKGEFETTAQYEARRALSLSESMSVLVISKQPEDRKYFEYDADAGLLHVVSYVFDNKGTDIWGIFYSAGLYGKIDFSSTTNLEIAISQTDKPQGTYTGTNAYGAKVEVVKILRETKSIFERSQKVTETTFPAADKKPYYVGDLRISAEEAKRLKPELRIAIVAAPKEPYIVKGRRNLGSATITNPREITEDFTILVADIRCGLLLDGTNTVLGSYPTR